MATDDVIARLDEIHRAEITAVIQYSAHAAELRNLGIEKLAKEMEEEAREELGHAARVADRIHFLGGRPTYVPLAEAKTGEDLLTILRQDLELERDAVRRYNGAIEACLAAKDAGTRVLLEELIASEEEHVASISLMLSQIERMGMPGALLCICGGGVPSSDLSA